MMQSMSADLDLPYTSHAHRRRNERCKSKSTLQDLYRHFDRDVYVRNGVWAWSVTRDMLEDLVDDGIIVRKQADRLTNLVILVAENDNKVVTIIRGDRRVGRYYRRRS